MKWAALDKGSFESQGIKKVIGNSKLDSHAILGGDIRTEIKSWLWAIGVN